MAGRLQEGTQHKALCLRSAERNRVFVMRKVRMEHPVFCAAPDAADTLGRGAAWSMDVILLSSLMQIFRASISDAEFSRTLL